MISFDPDDLPKLAPWRAQAACAGADSRLFEPLDGRSGKAADDPRVIAALAYCARCPVVGECRDELSSALATPQVGVYGGEFVSPCEASARLAAAVRAAGLRRAPRRITAGKPGWPRAQGVA